MTGDSHYCRYPRWLARLVKRYRFGDIWYCYECGRAYRLTRTMGRPNWVRMRRET